MSRGDQEHIEQTKFIGVCREIGAGVYEQFPCIPELLKIYAVPNGHKRSMREAVKIKAEGGRPGILDLGLDIPRGGYMGLRMEFKAPGKINNTSKEQDGEIKHLKENGYFVCKATNPKQALQSVLYYLSLGNTVTGLSYEPDDRQMEIKKLYERLL